MIKPVGSSAGGSVSISAGLETHQSAKNKCMDTVYSHSVSYKKSKKPVAGNVINSSIGSLSIENISGVGIKPGVSWGSEIGSIAGSISNLLNVENMVNTVVKETSYAELNVHTGYQVQLDAAIQITCSENTVSFFTSKSSLNKAKVLAISNKILVNDDLRKINSQSNWKLIELWQKAIIEFKSSEVASLVVSKWLVFMRKNFVHHQALLYTLLVGTMAYDLSVLVEAYGKKTCFIGCNPVSYDEASKLAVIGSVPVFKSVSLCWASFSLVCCAKCKQFGHVFDVCSVGGNFGVHEKWMITDQDQIHLANIYKKKQAPIVCSVSFGDKTWAQVADSFFSLLGSLSSLGIGPSLSTKFSIGAWSSFNSADPHGVSNIVRKLSFVELVLLPSISHELLLAVFTHLTSEVNLDMVLNGVPKSFAPFFSVVVDDASGFSLSSSKILTTKFSINQIGLFVFWFWLPITFFIPISSLVWKFATCNVRSINVPAKQVDTKLRSSFGLWIKDKYDGVQIFTSGLDVGYLGAGVVVVINNSLACHFSKIKVVSGQVILVQFLFKGKLSVSVLSLYTGASTDIHFGQASKVNFIIAKTVNISTFVVLDGDFNECRSGRSTSFKFCLSLGLVNSFNGYYLIKTPMWCNSRGTKRTIDYIFVNKSLFFTVVKHWVGSVSNFFDMNHNTVMVLVGLGGLLNVQLNGLHKQVYKNCWKFKIKDVDSTEWSCFKDCSSIRILIIKVRFLATAAGYNLDTMWLLLERTLVSSADEIFSRLWFSDFQCSKNKWFSKFLGLELLVAKIVKRLKSDDTFRFNRLVEKWSILDADKALVLRDIIYADQKMMDVLKYLSIVKKGYRKSKMYELKLVQKTSIRAAIKKCIEKFCSDKGNMIRSVLDRLFWKVVLNHLVVDDKLVLNPDGVKLNVDRIMKGWTRKYVVPSVLSNLSAYQYTPLDYVKDNAFSGVIDAINISELLVVVSGLLDGKATGFVMECLLVLLNECLFVGIVPALWKRAWTARKILSKILSDRVFFTCSKFGVLHSNNFLDMHKTYDSVGWHHLKTSLWCIKICDRFIKFFSSIHKDKINRVITDFGLSNNYKVHDSLDQGEVFLPLFWKIFYNSLLCEVKKHEHLCKYQINTKFVAKLDRVKSSGGMSSFFIGDCQASMQYALDIASEFFLINDISINSEKTVGVKVASLDINGQPIFIAKRGKTHRYLGIFLSTEGLSKPSLAKTHSDVHFFANIMLRKTITDKQFLYLVLAVLQLIINYCIQFSFVFLNVYHKWDALVKKSLKLKADFFCDFPDVALHHPLLYGLKSFKQIQAESKLAAVITFSNASGILGHLFNHRFLNLQVLGWAPLDLLQFPVKLCVNPVNNFLAGVVKIFLGNELSLANNLSCTFCDSGNFYMLLVLENAFYFGFVYFLKQFGVAFGDKLLDKKGFKRLDPRGSVPYWFNFTSGFLHDDNALSSGLARANQLSGLDILVSKEFSDLHSSLHKLWSDSFEIFTDGLLKNFGSSSVAGGAAAYFSAIDHSISVRVYGLMSSTLAELQAVALALKCVPFSSAVTVHLDSQAVIDTEKDLSISWVKVKDYFGVCGNIKADAAAGAAACFRFFLSIGVWEWLLIAKNMVMSGNACHFVRDLFRFVCWTHWEAGSGHNVIQSSLIECVNWSATSKV
ncbi:hypothetical protein G9A89_015880 [Geosiphon pyriformis]|nr:hypothetical protein G9A89_015880 [Geosiphon pyriformis]